SRLRLRLRRGKPDLRPRRSEAKTGKHQRSSNSQTTNSGERGASNLWNFGFGIYLEFGFWFLVFRPLVNRKSRYERSSLRLPPIAEEPRVHRRGRAHARTRHRGEHGDLQRSRRHAIEVAAGPKAGTTLPHRARRSARRD